MQVSLGMLTLYINMIENMFNCLKLKIMQLNQARSGVERTSSEISYISMRIIFDYSHMLLRLITCWSNAFGLDLKT